MSIPDKYKVDHLILLVGGNPLPNAVAGRLLVKPGGKVYLVHSEANSETKGTKLVATNLRGWFSTHEIIVEEKPFSVQESDSADIYRVVKAIADGKSNVGLHYTGGTKAMAVHAYRAVSDATKGQAIFSYLDPRAMKIRFDNGTVYKSAGHFSLSIEDFLRLHDLAEKEKPPTNEAQLPKSAQALADVFGDKEAFQIWRDWLTESFEKKTRKRNWVSKTELQAVQLDWPNEHALLENFVTTWKEETECANFCPEKLAKTNILRKGKRYRPNKLLVNGYMANGWNIIYWHSYKN